MGERIAIVEDERLVRELVAVNLRHAGYEIVSAENFDEGQYLRLNDDVRVAVSQGAFSSGYQHYLLCGRLEGRLGAGVFSVL